MRNGLNHLDRYLWRQLSLATLVITTSLTLIVWITQSLKLIDFIVNRGIPLSTFAYLAVLTLPALLPLLLPITVFLALLFILYRLSADSELLVMHSGGYSAARIARTPLQFSAVVMLLTYTLTLWVTPWSVGEFKNLQFRLRNDYSMTLLEEGVFSRLSAGITVFIRERGRDGTLHGIIVHDNRNPEQPVTVIAQKGAMQLQSGVPIISVINGSRQVYNEKNHSVAMLYFDSYTLNLQQAFARYTDTRTADPKEMSLNELLFPAADLDRATQIRYAGLAHQRLLSPLSIVLFTLVALATFRDCLPRRQSLGQRMALCLVATTLAQTLILFSYNLIGKTSALHGLWLALAYALPILLAIGLIVYLLAPNFRRPSAVEAA